MEFQKDKVLFKDRIEKALFLGREAIESISDVPENYSPDDVFIVWFSKTLQNWKALVSASFAGAPYVELTYNGDKKETYIDVYKKIENVRIPD